jgi:hypothetical protein
VTVPLVETLSVEVPVGVTELVLNVAPTPDGAPDTDNPTDELKPFNAVRLTL